MQDDMMMLANCDEAVSFEAALFYFLGLKLLSSRLSDISCTLIIMWPLVTVTCLPTLSTNQIACYLLSSNKIAAFYLTSLRIANIGLKKCWHLPNCVLIGRTPKIMGKVAVQFYVCFRADEGRDRGEGGRYRN